MTLDLDWADIFLPSVPMLEIVIRGTLVYLILFIVLRLIMKRIGGSTIGLADILMIALVAAAAQNAIAREQHSVSDAAILVATLAFWAYALDWLGHRFPQFQRFYNPPPLLLIKDGRMIRPNMRRELITEDELLSQLRRAGITDLSQIKEAYMEGDGHITVIELPREGA